MDSQLPAAAAAVEAAALAEEKQRLAREEYRFLKHLQELWENIFAILNDNYFHEVRSQQLDTIPVRYQVLVHALTAVHDSVYDLDSTENGISNALHQLYEELEAHPFAGNKESLAAKFGKVSVKVSEFRNELSNATNEIGGTLGWLERSLNEIQGSVDDFHSQLVKKASAQDLEE